MCHGVRRVSVCRCVFCKQETAYEVRISDWRSDVCSSDLTEPGHTGGLLPFGERRHRKCVCRAIGPALGDDRANSDAEAKFQIVRNKSLPPSQGVGIWIESFVFVNLPSLHLGPPFEHPLARVSAAHPPAEPPLRSDKRA